MSDRDQDAVIASTEDRFFHLLVASTEDRFFSSIDRDNNSTKDRRSQTIGQRDQ